MKNMGGGARPPPQLPLGFEHHAAPSPLFMRLSEGKPPPGWVVVRLLRGVLCGVGRLALEGGAGRGGGGDEPAGEPHGGLGPRGAPARSPGNKRMKANYVMVRVK